MTGGFGLNGLQRSLPTLIMLYSVLQEMTSALAGGADVLCNVQAQLLFFRLQEAKVTRMRLKAKERDLCVAPGDAVDHWEKDLQGKQCFS